MNRIGKRIVTLKMIAEAAEVHTSTVSLALRNDPRLPETTRRQIQDTAQRLGYCPNPLISLLMARVRRSKTGYRGTLAYLHTVPPGSEPLAGCVHRNFVAGAKRRAGQLGYRLDELHLTAERASSGRIQRVLQTRGILGIVLEHTPSAACPERRFPFDLEAYAVATLGAPLAQPQLHYIANDQYMRSVIAARELLTLGYRRLGLVVDARSDTAMAHRCSAGFWAVQNYSQTLPPLSICRLTPGDAAGLTAWLRKEKPDAVLDFHAGTFPLLESLGRRVPEDLGWIDLDWLPSSLPAAGVYGNSDHSGAAAVEIVVSQLHRGEAGPPARAMNHFVAGSWMPGGSIRRIGPPLDLDASFFSELLRT